MDLKTSITFTATASASMINDGEAWHPLVITQMGDDPPLYLLSSARFDTKEEAIVNAQIGAAWEVERFRRIAEQFANREPLTHISLHEFPKFKTPEAFPELEETRKLIERWNLYDI